MTSQNKKALVAMERVIMRAKAYVTRGDKPDRAVYMENEQDCIDLRYALQPAPIDIEQIKADSVKYWAQQIQFSHPKLVINGIVEYLASRGLITQKVADGFGPTIKVESVGQIKQNDQLILYPKNEAYPIMVKAWRVKITEHDGEEIIWNMARNKYFNVGMMLDGKSFIERAYIIQPIGCAYHELTQQGK